MAFSIRNIGRVVTQGDKPAPRFGLETQTAAAAKLRELADMIDAGTALVQDVQLTLAMPSNDFAANTMTVKFVEMELPAAAQEKPHDQQ
jgi:hypothetical protein